MQQQISQRPSRAERRYTKTHVFSKRVAVDPLHRESHPFLYIQTLVRAMGYGGRVDGTRSSSSPHQVLLSARGPFLNGATLNRLHRAVRDITDAYAINDCFRGSVVDVQALPYLLCCGETLLPFRFGQTFGYSYMP